jgi:hypothetical protein
VKLLILIGIHLLVLALQLLIATEQLLILFVLSFKLFDDIISQRIQILKLSKLLSAVT